MASRVWPSRPPPPVSAFLAWPPGLPSRRLAALLGRPRALCAPFCVFPAPVRPVGSGCPGSRWVGFSGFGTPFSHPHAAVLAHITSSTTYVLIGYCNCVTRPSGWFQGAGSGATPAPPRAPLIVLVLALTGGVSGSRVWCDPGTPPGPALVRISSSSVVSVASVAVLPRRFFPCQVPCLTATPPPTCTRSS